MGVRAWARRLPLIARFEVTVEALRARNRKLQEQNRRLRAHRDELAVRERHPREAWVPPGRDRRLELARSSGLFDADWYLSQLTVNELNEARDDVLAHFVDHGEIAGHAPHPGFVPDHYAPRKAHVPRRLRAVVNFPFTHYLDLGARQGLSPHPLFDAAAYLVAHPDSGAAPGGPLGAFLSRTEPLLPAEGGTGEPWDDPAEFLAAARAAGETVRETRGYEHIVRDRVTFDTESEARTKAELYAHPLPTTPPVVSVVVTGDESAAALESVLAQNYPHCQVIVVTEGDAGPPVRFPKTARDRRVEWVRSRGEGRSAARNAALQRATGRFVAYLDEGCTWFPDFLELMVRRLVNSSGGAAYAVTEVVEGDQRLFRGLQFDPDQLREGDISGNGTLVHERSLLERTGGFAEDLSEAADWDLLIRLAAHTPVAFVPVRGARCEQRGGADSPTDERLVRHRMLVDFNAVRVRSLNPSLLSIVMALDAEADGAMAASSLQRALQTAAGPVEAVVVDAKCRAGAFTTVYAHLSQTPGVTLHRVCHPLTMEVARNLGLSMTSGRSVVFVPYAA